MIGREQLDLQNEALDNFREYKPGEVDWLNQVPVGWSIKPLKYVVPSITVGIVVTPAKYYENSGVPCLRSLNISSREISTDDLVFISESSNELHKKSMIFQGDVVLVRTGATGSAVVVPREFDRANCIDLLIVRRSDLIDSQYLAHQLNSWIVQHQVRLGSNGAIQAHYNTSTLCNLMVLVPPLSEQQSIVSFLNHKRSQIDSLIAKKNRLIELLNEKRAALTTRAVTKGLDPNVPLKDSGVEWLGEIPRHWECRTAGRIAQSIQTGPFGTQLHSDDYISDGIPVINPVHLKEGRITPSPQCTVSDEVKESLLRHELLIGDIVFARRGELGRCAMVTRKEQGWLCGTGSIRLRPGLEAAHPAFLNFVLATKGTAEWLLLNSVGATMDNLNEAIISGLPIPVPPVEEQKVIASYLDEKITQIEKLVAEIHRSIEKLKEYRTALISAAVTGKIDVRQEAAHD